MPGGLVINTVDNLAALFEVDAQFFQGANDHVARLLAAQFSQPDVLGEVVEGRIEVVAGAHEITKTGDDVATVPQVAGGAQAVEQGAIGVVPGQQ